MIESLIETIKNVATVQTEYDPEEFAMFEELYTHFLSLYPPITRFSYYLKFLRLTGGAFIDATNYSLAIYGFGGEIVTSFEEVRLFLDRDQYLHFADFVRPLESDTIYVLAFDLRSESDAVYITEDEVWVYEHFTDSFCDMLKKFADGEV
jgi:hypothetical protein